MSHDTTIKRIQELVPSVMALEEGCVIKDFWKRKLEILAVYSIKGESDVYDYVFRGEEEVSVERSPIGNWEILGKPITLSIALMAIEAKMNMKSGNRGGELIMLWNLSKDNFNDQSDETKTFIGELLN